MALENGLGPLTTVGAPAAYGPVASTLDPYAVFAAMPGPLAVFAADAPRFTLLLASDALVALAGRPREALVGLPLDEARPDPGPATPEEGPRSVRALLEAAVRTGAAQRLSHQRYDLQGPDGAWKERYWDASATPVRGSDGAVRWLLLQVEDVTTLVRDEQAAERTLEALHETEVRAAGQLAQLEAIYRDAPVGLAVLDRELRYRHVNDRLAEMNGVPAAAHLGRRVRDVVADLADEVEAIARQVLETGEPLRELLISGRTAAQPDALRHWVEQWYPLRDASGEIVGINVVVEEVTERMRAEQELRASEARFRSVAHLVPDLLWQSAPDGRAVWYNDRWLEYTGQTPDEAAELGWMHAIHPDDRARSMAEYAAAVAERRPMQVEHRVRSATGEYRWFLVRAEPQLDPTGQPTLWLGAATDVHAQRLALEEVERRVAARSMELAEAEAERDALRRQLSAAEEAERRRLARELHDQLGQHLTAFALGLAEARRLIERGEPAAARLAQLEELSRRMTRDARHLALELRPPELDDVGLVSALATYVEQWRARYAVAAELTVSGVASRRPLPPDVGTAVYRIVQEALTNVARHADARQVTVLLDEGDGALRLVVEDDGRGFDVEAVAARGRAERRLGVASMRERAALVGGAVEIESSPGGGTTIYVRIPLGGVTRA